MHNFLNYIDPGTGSMLLTVILGVITTMVFVFRGLFIKFKFKIAGGKAEDMNQEKVPCIIFSDHKRYWNVFKPICDELEKRKLRCEFWTLSEDDPALSEHYEYIKCIFIGEGSRGFARLNMMKANICLCTTPGLDVLQWKRSKNVDWYVHTYHSVGDNLMYRMFGLDYFDAILASGVIQEKAVRTIEGKRGIPAKEIVMVGSTYMDVMRDRKNALPEITEDKPRTVLLAPSWGKSSILSRYGENFIQKLIDTGYRIIVRPHPQTKMSEADMLDALMKKFPETDKFSWNFDNDNFKVLNEADIMISDFSGVIFDYTFIFDKPLIYADTSLDTAPYDAAWADYTSWTLAVLPRLGQVLTEENISNIKSVIDETIASEKFKEGRRTAREEAWIYPGEAAVRTADYIVNKNAELQKNGK